MKTIVRIAVCSFLLLEGCMHDKFYNNLVIENHSNSFISFIFTGDTTQGNAMVFELIRNGTSLRKMADIISYPIKPKDKGFIKTMGNWKKKVETDTSLNYLYLVNLNMIDSLNKLASDSMRIKNEATTLIKVTYRDLKNRNWKVVYNTPR